MASSRQQPKPQYFEIGGEPEFIINDLKMESAGGGNIRIYCYALRHGEYRLQFSVVATPAELADMARKVMHGAADAHNIQMWEDDSSTH